MKATVESITPSKAEEYLVMNTHNRTLSKSWVRTLANWMQEGKYKENGDSIRISKTGVLLDGQHRLHAIIKSGISANMVVVTDLDDDVFTTIDGPKGRTASDDASAAKIPNSVPVSAGIRGYLVLKHGSRAIMGIPKGLASRDDILEEYYNSDGLYQKLVEETRKVYYASGRAFKISEMVAISAYLIKVLEHDIEKVLAFWDNCSGMAPYPHSACVLLKQRFVSAINPFDAKAKLASQQRIILIAKAWNNFNEGRKLGVLKWDPKVEPDYWFK